ncbi:Hsp20/alpha crystallin family protein [Sphingomonas kyungheensis]|uniref:Hsp20/alpha crystallin family protein n=1 Tax=Sphingomonas kyungheensis TaxID=1069987 RepID=A0ABU8H0N0_9SPHN
MAIRDLIPWSRQDHRAVPAVGLRDAEGACDTPPLLSLHREMNRLFDDVLHGFGAPSFATERLAVPSVELSETDQAIRVTAELPGLEQKDVELSIEDQVLTLRGEKKAEVADEARGYSERRYGRFERRIGLPRGIDADKATAAFAHGVLTVTIPRTAAAGDAVRRIPIHAGSG